MALTTTQRLQACDLLILELLVMDDRFAELHELARQTGYTKISGRITALRQEIRTTTTTISGKKAAIKDHP